MAVRKNQTLLMIGCLFMSIVLSGCGGQPLSEREIVRGIFFAHQGNEISACLVLADQKAESGSDSNKIAAAKGKTPAQALARAEESLYGDVYYGLLDLVALPGDADLPTVRAIGELLYESAQPAPELSVFMLDSSCIQSWAKQGSALYTNMKDLEKTYKVHCGLQQLFTQENVCAIPGYHNGAGYDFYLLPAEGRPVRCSGLAGAQLAAALCGQTSYFQGTFAFGTASCEARIQVLADENILQLHLRDVTLTALDADLKDESLQMLLQKELQNSFADLQQKMHQSGADPFHLAFWKFCVSGPQDSDQKIAFDIIYD